MTIVDMLTQVPTPHIPRAKLAPPAIREAGPEDRESVIDLLVAASNADPNYLPLLTGAPREKFADWYDSKPLSKQLVAHVDGLVVGHVGARPGIADEARLHLGEADGDWWELARMAVHPTYQRRGLGSSLLRLQHYQVPGPMYLTCYEHSAASRMYESCGWDERGSVWFADDPNPGRVFTCWRAAEL